MKRPLALLLFFLVAFACGKAQEYDGWRSKTPSLPDTAYASYQLGGQDAVLLPRLWLPEPFYLSPWQLHEGFNAQLGMSVTAGFGKNSPRGVGIGSNAAFVYAVPLGGRFSAIGGVAMNTMSWGSMKMRDASVFGAAAYQVNERVNVYAFGQKSLIPSGQRFRAYPGFGEDSWGGAVDFKLGEHAFLQFGVSQSRRRMP